MNGKVGKAGRVYRLTPKAEKLLPIAARFVKELEQTGEDWDLANFAKFWADIEYDFAAREKFQSFYGQCNLGDCDTCIDQHACAGDTWEDDWEDREDFLP